MKMNQSRTSSLSRFQTNARGAFLPASDLPFGPSIAILLSFRRRYISALLYTAGPSQHRATPCASFQNLTAPWVFETQFWLAIFAAFMLPEWLCRYPSSNTVAVTRRTPSSWMYAKIKIASGVRSTVPRGQSDRRVASSLSRRKCATPRWTSRDRRRASRVMPALYCTSNRKRTKPSNHSLALDIQGADQPSLHFTPITS